MINHESKLFTSCAQENASEFRSTVYPTLDAVPDDDGGRPVLEDENDFSISATNWFALDEWDALSDEQKDKYDGDRVIMGSEFVVID